MNLEGCCHSLIKALFRNLPAGTEEDDEKPQSGYMLHVGETINLTGWKAPLDDTR
jgi:hypothetical protein